MLIRLLVAVGIVVAAIGIARWWQGRRRVDPPTQTRGQLPEQVDRADFSGPDTPWLVVVFSSDTCSTCRDMIDKALVLQSEQVTVDVVSFQAAPRIHERYRIEAVPSLVVADGDGVVQVGFIGPVTATDLWAAVADTREPGSVERGACDHGDSASN